MHTDARQVLIDYLLMKVDQADWHGVSDAANDLRVLEAQRLIVPATSEIVSPTKPDTVRT
jgi:hypothetical protein